MAALYDLVAMTVSSAPGTGATISLGNAATINGVTFLSFATAGAAGGTTVAYSILDTGASEGGIATYTSSNTTLTNRTPTKSTNGNSAIAASSAAIILCSPRSEDIISTDLAQSFTAAQQNQARQNIVAQAAGDFSGMSNGTLVASAAAGALTVAVKTFAGADPSAADPVYFYFRDNTVGAGDFTRIAVTAALSVVLGSTKTLGAVSGTGVRVWIGAFNNAGAVQLAAIICTDSSGVFSPQEYIKYTTAVPANATKAWYSTSAIVTAAPWRLIGFCEWFSLTTAGTWVVPDRIQLFGPGVPKPGDVVQRNLGSSNVQTSTTSNTAVNTNVTVNLAPSSFANMVRCTFGTTVEISVAGARGYAELYRDLIVLASQNVYDNGGLNQMSIGGVWLDIPNRTSASTFQLKVRNADNTSTVKLPGSAGAVGMILVEEIMS